MGLFYDLLTMSIPLPYNIPHKDMRGSGVSWTWISQRAGQGGNRYGKAACHLRALR